MRDATLSLLNTLDVASGRDSNDARIFLSEPPVSVPRPAHARPPRRSRRPGVRQILPPPPGRAPRPRRRLDRALHPPRCAPPLLRLPAPDARAAAALLTSSTPYQYDARTRTYHQPAAAQELLRRLARVNARALQRIHTQDPVRLRAGAGAFATGTPLGALVDAGVRDAGAAADALGAVLEQLARQTQCVPRPPPPRD